MTDAQEPKTSKFPVTESPFPTADGKVFNLKETHGEKTSYQDSHHTNRLDNFTSMEVTLKSRCHGMQLEGLAYPITPIGMHYILIHYDIPIIDEAKHRLHVNGCVRNPLVLDMENIRKRPKVTLPVTMECGGNGRINQQWRYLTHVPWNNEAIGTSNWMGTPLGPILKEAGVLKDGVDVVFTGIDKGIQGEQVQYYQRSLSVEHAMDGNVMLAYEMNGQPLTPQHGFPVRLIVPGWLGMASVKWLDRIEVIDKKFTGLQMKWYSFAKSDEDEERILCTNQRVRALMIPPGIPDFFTRFRYLEEAAVVPLTGRAWAGPIAIKSVEVSTDGGKTWNNAKLDKPIGKFAWVGWSYEWKNVTRGEHILRVRATDMEGNTQSEIDFSPEDFYAMDVTKPQYVNVVVLSKGSLEHGAHVDVPLRFPSY